MTVVVWDGKIMAADRLALRYDRTFAVTKIKKIEYTNNEHREQEALVGYSGNLVGMTQFFDWIKRELELVGTNTPNDVPEPKAHTSREDENGGIAMVILKGPESKQVKIMVFDHSLTGYQVQQEHFFVGSGGQLAEVALRCGKNAVEAVQIASEVNCLCGLGYDSLEFSY